MKNNTFTQYKKKIIKYHTLIFFIIGFGLFTFACFVWEANYFYENNQLSNYRFNISGLIRALIYLPISFAVIGIIYFLHRIKWKLCWCFLGVLSLAFFSFSIYKNTPKIRFQDSFTLGNNANYTLLSASSSSKGGSLKYWGELHIGNEFESSILKTTKWQLVNDKKKEIIPSVYELYSNKINNADKIYKWLPFRGRYLILSGDIAFFISYTYIK